MHPNSPILASCPPRPARDCGRPAQAATRTHQPPSGNSQKTAKPASPRFAGHTPQPMPSCFPHASDPHTGHILIQPQSDHAPAETSGRLTRIHASSQLTQIPCADEGGMGVSVRHRFAMRRRQRRRRVGVDDRGGSTCVVRLSGLKARWIARPKAGMYGTLGACSYGPPKGGLCVLMTARLIGSEDPIIVRPRGRTDGGQLYRGTAHGQWLTHTSGIKPVSQQAGTANRASNMASA